MTRPLVNHNRLQSRLLKGEGFLPNSDMQLPNPPDDDPGCSSSVCQTETRKVSGTNKKVTSQIVVPMFHKSKNQDRKFEKIKIAAKEPAQANKKFQIPCYVPRVHDPGFTSDDPVDIFLTFSQVPHRCHAGNIPISTLNKRKNTQPD